MTACSSKHCGANFITVPNSKKIRLGGAIFEINGGSEMTAKQQSLIDTLISGLPESDKPFYNEIIDHITLLGYIPQKQSVADLVLSFKHSANKKVIAKIGIRKGCGFIAIKFFACKYVPEKFVKALCDEHQNAVNDPRMVITPDDEPVPPGVIMKPCTLGLCSVCTGGKMRYFYTTDEKVIFRCGAYPVLIPDITKNDVADMKRLLSEQHDYFMSLE
jgi:hypothetical protein